MGWNVTGTFRADSFFPFICLLAVANFKALEKLLNESESVGYIKDWAE